MLLAACALPKHDGFQEWLFELIHSAWKVLLLLSEAAEIANEGVVFALGRAVARVGRGFERGYHISRQL
jgi:hypothetical protein